MLGMGLPVHRVFLGQRLIADDQQVLGVMLFGGSREVKAPVIMAASSRIIILLWTMAC
jgi:hypothetical protein